MAIPYEAERHVARHDMVAVLAVQLSPRLPHWSCRPRVVAAVRFCGVDNPSARSFNVSALGRGEAGILSEMDE